MGAKTHTRMGAKTHTHTNTKELPRKSQTVPQKQCSSVIIPLVVSFASARTLALRPTGHLIQRQNIPFF